MIDVAKIETDPIEAYAEAFGSEWANQLSLVPAHLRAGLVRYIACGVPPGSFLRSVLEGDLFQAFRRGDEVSLAGLHGIVMFLENAAPGRCYGAPAHVRNWILERQRAMGEGQ